jgi:hypothetical protein
MQGAFAASDASFYAGYSSPYGGWGIDPSQLAAPLGPKSLWGLNSVAPVVPSHHQTMCFPAAPAPGSTMMSGMGLTPANIGMGASSGGVGVGGACPYAPPSASPYHLYGASTGARTSDSCTTTSLAALRLKAKEHAASALPTYNSPPSSLQAASRRSAQNPATFSACQFAATAAAMQ